jgi:hypothetical protein
MTIKTHTFYRDIKTGLPKGIARKLSRGTLIKRHAGRPAYYVDIDANNPSKGYFNKRPIMDI